jgi:hypothetical protein
MARSYRKYTNEDIINNAKTVYSIAGLLKSLGLKPAGGSYSSIKCQLQKLKVDTSHWTGQGWNKNIQTKDWIQYNRNTHCKKHLIESRGRKCENCKLKAWLNNPIPIELHHIDGDRTNNDINNLQLLCPNCHSFTHNWKGKNRGKRINTI